MNVKLTYDQIPESEQSEIFTDFMELLEFAIDNLNGHYYPSMSLQRLMGELESNGYYVDVTF